MTFIRVFDGVMTVSMYPRSAATYGLASASSYCLMNAARASSTDSPASPAFFSSLR